MSNKTFWTRIRTALGSSQADPEGEPKQASAPAVEVPREYSMTQAQARESLRWSEIIKKRIGVQQKEAIRLNKDVVTADKTKRDALRKDMIVLYKDLVANLGILIQEVEADCSDPAVRREKVEVLKQKLNFFKDALETCLRLESISETLHGAKASSENMDHQAYEQVKRVFDLAEQTGRDPMGLLRDYINESKGSLSWEEDVAPYLKIIQAEQTGGHKRTLH